MKSKFLYLLIFLGLSIAFTSCEQSDVDLTTDEATLVEFISLATNATTNAIANTTDPAKTETTCVGKKSKLTEISVSELSSTITSYITTNYADATIERAGKTTQGGFVVHIKQADGTTLALLFDAAGAFVSADTHHRKGTLVAVENLPEAITNYISATYSGATIKKAVQDSAGNYVVVVKKSDETIIGVAFDAAGTFTSELALEGEFGCGKGGRGHKGGKGKKNPTTSTAASN